MVLFFDDSLISRFSSMKSKIPSPKNNSESEEDVFTKLMEDHQITPLENNQKKIPRLKPNQLEINSDFKISSSGVINTGKYSGLEKDTLKPSHTKSVKINRHFQADFSLDLHGETRDSALQKAKYAMRTAKQKQYQTLLIVTGKGITSKQSVGVIKSVIWDWLSYEKKEGNIVDFKTAPNFLGGGGALLVFFY